MMARQAPQSGLVMGFDNHIIAGSRVCSYIDPGFLSRPLPTRQARTMPRPWVRRFLEDLQVAPNSQQSDIRMVKLAEALRAGGP
jgi:hypothetical protein